MNSFWSIWVVVLTLATIIGVLWLLLANRKTLPKSQGKDQGKGEDNKTGHVYDGIEEYDNPLPAWWMHLFLLSIFFGVAYLIAYPGMGNFKGMLNWTQEKQFNNELAKADAEFINIYNSLGDKTVEGLAKNDKAVKMGQRLFSNNCSVCHGADAGGSKGYPNLRDSDWLYGGSGDEIKQTIVGGRQAAMPAWGSILGEEKTLQVAAYVKALSQQKAEDAGVAAGKETFMNYCSACHGVGGDGSTMMGAPRLNDDVWLYGGSEETIATSIRSGRNGKMPAHGELLSDERIQLLAAYVYSLSH